MPAPTQRRPIWFPITLAALFLAFIIVMVERNELRANWWAHQFRRTHDLKDRGYYLACLASVGNSARGAIAQLVDSNDPADRSAAVFLIARLPNEQFAEPFSEKLLQDPDRQIRESIATALAFRQSPRAINLLKRFALQRDPSSAAAAVQALAQVPTELAAQTLCDAAHRQDSPQVRAEAIVALGELLHPTTPATSKPSEKTPATQPSSACDLLANIVDHLNDDGRFDQPLSIEFQTQQLTAAVTTRTGRPAASSMPERRTVADVAKSTLQDLTGQLITLPPHPTNAQIAGTLAHCRDLIARRQSPQ